MHPGSIPGEASTAASIHRKADQHLPGDEEVLLVGEHRASGERESFLSNLPPKASLRRIASAIEAR